MNIIVIFIMCVSLLYESCSQAVVIGSSTEVSVITTSTLFPAADTNNTMLDFGWFQGGFTLEDATTSCTFNSVYPISGTVNMNGGTLYLMQDIVLANPTQLDGLGTIIGNGHSVEFCETITVLPANLQLIKDVNVFFNGDVELTSTLTVQGTCLVVGNGNVLDLENGGNIVIDTNSQLTLHGMRLEYVADGSIACVDDTAHLVLNDVLVCLMGNVHFLYGDITFQSIVKIIGNNTFWYDSNMPCLIDDEAMLRMDGGVVFKFGKKVVGGDDPIIFYDDESVLSCGESTFWVTSNGVNLKRGRLELEKNVLINVESTNTANGLILGDGVTASEDMLVYLGPGSVVTFAYGAMCYNNVSPDKFCAASNSSTLLRKLNSVFHVTSNCVFPPANLILETDGTHFPVSSVADGVAVRWYQTRQVVPGFCDVTYNGYYSIPWLVSLKGGDSVYLSSGILYENIAVSGPGNMISGNGSLNGAITFADSNSQLIFGLMGSCLSTIDLKGGMLILTNGITLQQPNCFLSSGIINIGKYIVNLEYVTSQTGQTQFIYDTPVTWMGNNGAINLLHDTSLSSTWTIQGTCTLDGNFNALTITQGGHLVVAPGSKLIIKNMRLNILDSDSIACVDDTGAITLDTVTWVQADDYEFDTGALNFKGNVLLTGQGLSFTYMSTCTSTILSNANLTLDNLFTFNYNPSNSATTLLSCADYTSQFSMKHSVLNIVPGLQLTKGVISFSNAPTIYAYGNGLTFGDEITSDDDMQLIFSDTSNLTIAAGTVIYKNLNFNAIQMWNSNAMLFLQGTTLQLYRNINMQTGYIYFGTSLGTATYVHRQTPCPTTSDIFPTTNWGNSYLEEFFC